MIFDINGSVISSGASSNSISHCFSGKKAVAFGTSLTYRAKTTNGYLTHLASYSGMTIDNQGVGSSKIYGDAETSILNMVRAYDKYDEIDVCIIEGFVNDWFQISPIGDIYDTDETSVCGCLYTAINYVLSQNADIRIFVILDHFGINKRGADFSPSISRGGNHQLDYYEKIASVCDLYGIKCIKEYSICWMNANTDDCYYDYIHLSATGAVRSGKAIWDEMKLATI